MPYPTEIQGWKVTVRGKWLLFDSDAIISILSYGLENIFEELEELGVSLLYIHPVLLELMNTNSSTEKLRRSKLLIDHDFIQMPLNSPETKLSSRIQKSLPLKCQPSPTDLYLGSIVAVHNNKDRLLITGNIKDFPSPLYTREGHMILQSETSIRTLSILCIDKEKLIE